MKFKIPYFGNGTKDTAKKELLSPSGGAYKRQKKHQTLPEEASPTT